MVAAVGEGDGDGVGAADGAGGEEFEQHDGGRARDARGKGAVLGEEGVEECGLQRGGEGGALGAFAVAVGGGVVEDAVEGGVGH